MATVLLDAARHFPAVVVIGPQPAGKTTLLRKLFPKAQYLLLEDPDVQARTERSPRLPRGTPSFSRLRRDSEHARVTCICSYRYRHRPAADGAMAVHWGPKRRRSCKALANPWRGGRPSSNFSVQSFGNEEGEPAATEGSPRCSLGRSSQPLVCFLLLTCKRTERCTSDHQCAGIGNVSPFPRTPSQPSRRDLS